MNRDFSQFKRVVVYRIGSLGDTLVVLPAFHLVRRTFPEAHITLLTNVPVNARAAPMETILEHTHLYDDLLRYPTSLRGISQLQELRSTLAAGHYDCLVYLTEPKGGIATSIRDYLFFRLCGIRRIVGVPFSRRTLRPVPEPGSERYVSETARVLECIGQLGTVDLNDPWSWDLRLTSTERTEAEAVLGSHGISGRFLAASVGTKIQANDWEERNWKSLMERLAAHFAGLPLVLVGANEERARSERLLQVWTGPKANLCGVTSPRVSAAILSGAAVMVCHDSGPMHLAATMGVPCVAIFSARNPPGVWYPRGKKHTVLYHQTPCWGCKLTECIEQKKACILSITVDEVFAAVRKQMERGGTM
jgi:ADP-heptose:LPS heptosyltransferase